MTPLVAKDGDLIYVDCEMEDDETLDEWRRRTHPPQPRHSPWWVAGIGVLLVVLAVVLPVGAADAMSRDQYTARFVEVAEAHWDQRPPCGRPVVEWDGEDADGYWIATKPCTLHLRASLTAAAIKRGAVWWCSTVAHEYGHALGFDHEDGGVMDPHRSAPMVDGCRERTRCSALTRRLFRCRATVAGITVDRWRERWQERLLYP